MLRLGHRALNGGPPVTTAASSGDNPDSDIDKLATWAQAGLDPASVSVMSPNHNGGSFIVEACNRAAGLGEVVRNADVASMLGASTAESLYDQYCAGPALFFNIVPDSKLQPS